LEIFSLIFFLIGAFFLIMGTMGMIIMKSNLIRIHFSGISDTVGVILIVGGLGFLYPENLWKFLLLIVLLAITGPISAMAIARAVFERGKRK